MCLSNLYVFFKTGWSMGVTITAAILAFAFFRMLEAARLTKTPLTALENNALTTVSSGAGYMTGGGNMAAFGALLMVTTVRPDMLPMVFWFGDDRRHGRVRGHPDQAAADQQGSAGVPDRHRDRRDDQDDSRNLRRRSRGRASRRRWGTRPCSRPRSPGCGTRRRRGCRSTFPAPFRFRGRSPAGRPPSGRWPIKMEVVLIGAGALMSFRTAWSILLGGVMTYAVLAPALVEQGLVKTVSYKAIVGWTVWPGAAILVASGLTSFALDWRSVARAFTGMAKASASGAAATSIRSSASSARVGGSPSGSSASPPSSSR